MKKLVDTIKESASSTKVFTEILIPQKSDNISIEHFFTDLLDICELPEPLDDADFFRISDNEVNYVIADSKKEHQINLVKYVVIGINFKRKGLDITVAVKSGKKAELELTFSELK